MNWFKQAVTASDNKTIDPSFLVVMFTVFGVLPMVIVILSALSALDVWLNKHEAAVGALGGGIAAVIASVGALIVSCATILYQDRKPLAPATTTTTEQSTVVKTVAAAPPPITISGVTGPGDIEPLAPKIGPEDVGKNVALVRKSTKKGKRK